MQCEQVQTLLASLVFDELEPDTRGELDAHLQSCGECSRQLSEMRTALALVREGVEAAPEMRLSDQRRSALFHRTTRKSPTVLANLSWMQTAGVAAVLVIGMSTIALMMMPATGAARRTARNVQSSTQLRGIAQSLHTYAANNDGRLPDRVSRLVEQDYVTAESVLSPLAATDLPDDFAQWSNEKQAQWVDENASYDVLALNRSLESVDSPTTIVGVERPQPGVKDVAVVYGDARVERMPAEEAKKLVAKQRMTELALGSVGAGGSFSATFFGEEAAESGPSDDADPAHRGQRSGEPYASSVAPSAAPTPESEPGARHRLAQQGQATGEVIVDELSETGGTGGGGSGDQYSKLSLDWDGERQESWQAKPGMSADEMIHPVQPGDWTGGVGWGDGYVEFGERSQADNGVAGGRSPDDDLFRGDLGRAASPEPLAVLSNDKPPQQAPRDAPDAPADGDEAYWRSQPATGSSEMVDDPDSPVTQVYDVRDLLVVVPQAGEQADFDLSAHAEPEQAEQSAGRNLFGASDEDESAVGASLFSDGETSAEDMRREKRAEQLQELISSTVGRAEEWDIYGGDVSGIRQFDDKIIVTAPAERHREVSALLGKLRGEEGEKASNDVSEGTRPFAPILNYPVDWPEISRRRLPGIGAADPSEVNAAMAERLKKRIDVQFDGESFETVINKLRDATGANMHVDWTALAGEGVERDTPISLQLKDVPADQVLGLVLRQASADAEFNPVVSTVIEGIVTVSTQRDLSQHKETRIYRVGDLLDAENLAGRAVVSEQDVEQRTQDIIDIITETVGDAEDWENYGGDKASVTAVDGKLVIKGPDAYQQQVRGLLEALRGDEAATPAGPIVLAPDEAAAADAAGKAPAPAASVAEPAEADLAEAPAADAPAPMEAEPAPVFVAGPVNPFVLTQDDARSTFAIDVDTASYRIATNYIRRGMLPPAASVRMEEFVNAFDYNYPGNTAETFDVHVEGGPAPFGQGLTLLKIGVQGRVVGREARKPAHLVFVVDSSGSMARPDRIDLAQASLTMLVEQLSPHDHVSLVTYGADARLVLERAPVRDRQAIVDAIEAIQCGGSTNMIEGLTLGREVAQRGYSTGVNNRVILLSDGVANIGQTDADALLAATEQARDMGITFTSVGFGTGSYNDATLEALANRGDGSYFFIDSQQEAKRVFVDQFDATIETIARDVKIQVEFNKSRVRKYRLIGYENRDIADADFRNDAVDAGEVGSGQSATALYEVELLDGTQGDLGTVYVRFEDVETGQVRELASRIEATGVRERTPESDPRFYLAACAAEFAEMLRESEHARDADLGRLTDLMIKVCQRLPHDAQARHLLTLMQRADGLPRAK